jgi:hypothetical protein
VLEDHLNVKVTHKTKGRLLAFMKANVCVRGPFKCKGNPQIKPKKHFTHLKPQKKSTKSKERQIESIRNIIKQQNLDPEKKAEKVSR